MRFCELECYHMDTFSCAVGMKLGRVLQKACLCPRLLGCPSYPSRPLHPPVEYLPGADSFFGYPTALGSDRPAAVRLHSVAECRPIRSIAQGSKRGQHLRCIMLLRNETKRSLVFAARGRRRAQSSTHKQPHTVVTRHQSVHAKR